jgi:hypothetical protein
MCSSVVRIGTPLSLAQVFQIVAAVGVCERPRIATVMVQ